LNVLIKVKILINIVLHVDLGKFMSENEILRVKEKVESELLKKPGVKAVGMGNKLVNNKKTNELAIRVYVERKLKDLPEDQQIPTSISGIKTDVIELPGEPVLHTLDRAQMPFKAAGIDVGPSALFNGAMFDGTLGAIVRDNVSNNLALLSCWHVLVVDNDQKPGAPISQPAGTSNIIARLNVSAFGKLVDAATAIFNDQTNIFPEIRDHNNIVKRIMGSVDRTELDTMHMKTVLKRGVGSGVTFGAIQDTHFTPQKPFHYPFIGDQFHRDQILISPSNGSLFSTGGDSGSCIIADDGRIIGLLIAGLDGWSIANHIDDVLSQVHASLYTG
jgi:hypothetical protein